MSTSHAANLAELERQEAVVAARTAGDWERGDRFTFAGVLPKMFGEGKCSACEPLGLPAWIGKTDINGKRMLAHVHASDEPWWPPHGIFAVGELPNVVNVVNDTYEYGLMEDADAEAIVQAVNHDADRLAVVREMFEAHEDADGICYGNHLVTAWPCAEYLTAVRLLWGAR